MEEIDKLNIAKEMLDAAIDEYLDHHRYFAAYNLAGVAEELLGKFVRLNGGKDALTQSVESVKMVNKAINGEEFTDKEWKKEISKLKNSIKHLDSVNDRHISTDIKDEVRWKINDAVKNFDALNLNTTQNIERYFERWREIMRHNKSLNQIGAKDAPPG
ncbi:MAG: hypothetical protein GXP09_04870 [Gammaproteobacteria bacterium]|nr:hypothetical protein [Gammaproteobacteria bacterium]